MEKTPNQLHQLNNNTKLNLCQVHNWHWFIFGACCGGIVVLGLLSIFHNSVWISEPDVMIKEVQTIVYQPSPPEIQIVTETITNEVIRVVEKEVIKAVPNYEFVPFASSQELTQWLNINKVETMGTKACVAEALELQKRAFKDGYQMSTEALFYGVRESEDERWHMVNSTIIGQRIYFIEPVKGYIWLGGHAVEAVWR